MQATLGGDVRRLDSGIQFEAGEFDPITYRRAAALDGFELGKGEGVSIELVQFAGPIDSAWRNQLDTLGVKVLQFIPNYAYAVLADAQGRANLSAYAANSNVVRMTAALEPVYKLNANLSQRAAAGLSNLRDAEVTVVLANHAGNGTSKAVIESLARGALKSEWWSFGEFDAVTLSVRESDISTLANLADVFGVEHHVEPELLDEVQNQIIAGNFNANRSGPSGPGYLAWLTGRGFSSTPDDYPIVAVVDDGVGNGTIVNGAGDQTLTRERDGTTSRLAFSFNCSSDGNAAGVAGHGHINTSIVGGYDDRAALPFTDPNGYLRGQGVNPFGRMGNTKFFNNAGSAGLGNCGGSQESMIRNQHINGARISSNSWGASVGGDYNANAATYDAGTRDANGNVAGLQPMIFLIAAGNSGSGASTIGSPATAKNVITVGASENQRPTDEGGNWTDGCGVGPTGADSAMDVIAFSSRGPAEGGRVKPEVIAPGTHIQGTASTGAGYSGTGVCDQFRPPGQTVFAASSGTSHSTPAVAGLASLVYRYVQTQFQVAEPSAALVKAYMMAHPTYLTGESGNGNLPTNVQGFGMPNMGLAFDSTTSRVVRDQLPEDAFTNSGQEREFFLVVGDTSKPVRIAMAYSDAPGAVTGNPQVNNLDLIVDAGGQTLLGNRFTGQFSATGGSADTANNYEAVNLPAGTGGLLRVRVAAFNIGGDGIPGNADSTDQDFSLVCSNCAFGTAFALAASPGAATSCAGSGAAFSVNVLALGGFADSVSLSLPAPPSGLGATFTPSSGNAPFTSSLGVTTAGLAAGSFPLVIQGVSGDETRTTQVTLGHSTALAAAPTLVSPAGGAVDVAVAPTLSWNAVPGALQYVVELSTTSDFAVIAQTAVVSGTTYAVNPGLSGATGYFWRVRSRNNCGDGANATVRSFTTVPVFCATPGTAIPDNNAVGISSSINVAIDRPIEDLNVAFEARHTWIGDLIVTLTKVGSPTTVRLLDRPGRPDGGTTGNGCTGDNPNVILDDEAAAAAEASCVNTNPGYPIGGRFRPNDPLLAFDNASFAGEWRLTVSDLAGADTGFLDRWCLEPTLGTNATFLIRNDSFSVSEDAVLTRTAANGVLANDIGQNLVATLGSTTSEGALAFNANGSFVYTPANDYCGSDSFTYSATDGMEIGEAVATINVVCVNDAPVAVSDSYSGTEGQSLVVTAVFGVLSNDTDIDSASLTAVQFSAPASGTLTLASNGGFTYLPNPLFCGADSFQYRAFDGANHSQPATVAITLSCVNDPPVVANQTFRARVDAVNGATVGTILASDPDQGDSVASFTVTGGSGQAVFAVNATTGVITVSNAAALVVDTSLTLQVNVADTNGAVRSATMTIAVVGNAIFRHGFEPQ